LAIVQSLPERAAILTMFLVGSVEAATNFEVPLYIQIVQGRDAFQTAIAMLPFKLAVFFTAILIVRQFSRFTPRQIAGFAITIVAAGALWLAWVVRNDWNTFPMLVGLVAIGLARARWRRCYSMCWSALRPRNWPAMSAHCALRPTTSRPPWARPRWTLSH